MTAPAVTSAWDQDAIRRAVEATLDDFLAAEAHTAQRRCLPRAAAETLGGFLQSGGKRLRPLLCVYGWQAAGGHGVPHSVLRAAASLEMFHAFALIHDDIMDASDTRRGRPTVHRTVGTNAAILLGDFAFTWSDELLHTAGLTPAQLRAALPVVSTLRSQTLYGQYLDTAQAGCPTADLDQALAIIRYKTAKYTVEGPLLLGAALAGATENLRKALSAFAMPVGEAFQLRDDLLGVFGNPHHTGKSALDDLREGKATVLMALALQAADPAQRGTLHRHVGNAHLDRDGAAQVRAVLTDTGARQAVEQMIIQRRSSALSALNSASLPPHTTAVLRTLASDATARST